MVNSRKCTTCGAQILSGAPGSNCARCAYESALAYDMDEGPAEPSIAMEPKPAGTPRQGPGERIGRYRLLQKIGEGGCGIVYMAEQEEPVQRGVALKVIKLGMDTKEVIARFEAERQALAMMDHPNIAKVLDAGSTDTGRPYFVMELVRGARITEYCDKNNLPMAARLELFMKVCRAVQHAHQKGIIHRDIKPSNILVTAADGLAIPKVIDFGIAKATQGKLIDQTFFTAFEQFIGTPAYMSPEQAEMSATDIDTRCDIYSLGVLLYELLTGKTPFDTKELLQAGLDEMRRTIREREPAKPSTRLSTMLAAELTTAARQRQTEAPRLINTTRGDLDWIVMKCLEKDRARRYETANGLTQDIQRHLDNEPVIARPTSASYRARKWIRRNKLAFAATASVLTALIVGISVSTVSVFQTRAALRRAAQAAIEAQAALDTSDFAQANRLIAAGDGPDAAAYLSRILSNTPRHRAALARLTTLLTYNTWLVPTLCMQHQDWVTWARFSPDGKRVVTGSQDGTARVWDAQNGRAITPPLRFPAVERRAVTCVQFSPDGGRVVTASSDHTAGVWDAQTGQPLTPPLQHSGAVEWAEFSPDGKTVLTACDDGTARLWDATTGQLLMRFSGHSGAVTFVDFSPDGSKIVTASDDSTARIWDARTGQPLGEPMKHARRLTFALFSPDGKRIVTGSWDATARIWDCPSGQPVTAPLRHNDRVAFARVMLAQFSPDGTRLLTTAIGDPPRIWDARSGQQITTILEKDYRGAERAQFSPDGKRVVVGSVSGTARVWDAETGLPLTEPAQQAGAVWLAQFSPDGKRILTASADNTARIWDVQTEPPLARALPHAAWVRQAKFSPDGRRILTVSDDKTARIWDAATGQPLTEAMNQSGAITWGAFSPDGQRLATASDDHTARVWDAQTGKPITPPLPHMDVVHIAQFSPDGKRLVTASADQTAKVWDANTGQELLNLRHPKLVTWAEFSPDGRRIVTASWDFKARVWDAQTGKVLVSSIQHDGAVAAARFSPDGTRIATISADRTARIWDAKTGLPLTPPMNQRDYVLCAEFSRDGRMLVTSSRDGTARVWNSLNGQPLSEPLVHELCVNFAAFSPDGQEVVTASDEGAARLWDALSGQPLSAPLEHGAPLFMAEFSPDGKRIVTSCRDNTARVWDVGLAPSKCPTWLLPLAEVLSGKRLNQQGVLEETPLDRGKTIAQIRGELGNQPGDGDGVAWGRWLLADRAARTASPFCKITAREYKEIRIDGGLGSLEQAGKLASGSTESSNRVFAAQATRVSALESGARSLATDGRFAEAEAKLRRALDLRRSLWADQPSRWETDLVGLEEVMKLEGKLDDAERLWRQITIPVAKTQPQDAPLLERRAEFLARRGHWNDAAADISRAIALQPDQDWYYYELAILLVQSRQTDAYRRLCAEALRRFTGIADPHVAERIAKTCLIHPDAGAGIEDVNRLVETAMREPPQSSSFAYSEFVRGLAEYRQGRFAGAADWMWKVLKNPASDYQKGQAYVVLAMSQYRSRQRDGASASLAKGAEIFDTTIPGRQNGYLEGWWKEWIVLRALLDEAKTLMDAR